MPLLTAVFAMTLGWKLLDPLPDPVGYSGMFGADLHGKLVVGGGSQFPEKPNWLKGEKAFCDRILLLDSPDGHWRASASRLPLKLANAVFASDGERIYLAGGLNDSGCLTWAGVLRPDGDGFAVDRLPPLPEAAGYAAGTLVEGRLYVVGGLVTPAAKETSVHVYSLGVSGGVAETSWRREPDLPDRGVFVAGATAVGGRLLIIGGIGFDPSGKPVPDRRVLSFDPKARRWSQLADLPQARVGPSTPCPVVDGRIWVIGGYAEVFPGPAREHPGFSARTYAYDLGTGAWSEGPVLPTSPVPDRDKPGDPGPCPMIGAPCILWQGLAVSVGGEVRASVRTPCVIAWPVSKPFNH